MLFWGYQGSPNGCNFQGNELTILKKIFFETSYDSHWNVALSIIKYGSQKKILEIFDNFVRDEHRKHSRCFLDQMISERRLKFLRRRVESENNCVISFDRFYVKASLNSSDLSKLVTVMLVTSINW